MGNLQMKCHCTVLIHSITTFKASVHNTCCKPNHADYKREQKYLKKVDKQLSLLLKLLNESP